LVPCGAMAFTVGEAAHEKRTAFRHLRYDP
jgi:hypothetical protein